MKQAKPARLGHVHLKVRNLDRSIEFYQRHFGLELGERVGRYAFLHNGQDHHTVALQEIGSAPSPDDFALGLYHVAFEVDDIETFRAVIQELESQTVQHTAVDHGISFAVYFADPDGNGLEIYLDRRGTAGSSAWSGKSKVLAEV